MDLSILTVGKYKIEVKMDNVNFLAKGKLYKLRPFKVGLRLSFTKGVSTLRF
jgi:hypothetical protein